MKRRIIGLAAALCLLAGCAPHAREPDGLALVRVLGVDGGGGVTLTAVCGGLDQGDDSRGTVTAENFDGARRALPWAGQKEMALTNLSYIIIGEHADLEEALAYVLADHEMSPSATVWLAQDAGGLLTGSEDPAARLAVLTEQGVSAPTVVDALAALRNEGGVTLPALICVGEQLEVLGQVQWEERR